MNAGRPPRSPLAEQLHRKQQLAATFRLFSRLGFADGAGGHVTARDPLRPDHFWVNAFGQPFGRIRVSDLLLVDHDGVIVEGEGRINPAGYAIHSQIHAARPDAIAAAHTHSTFGQAWSTLGRLLDPLTQDACAFFEDHALYDDYSGVVLDLAEGKRIAAALGSTKAVILRNHGLLTVGGSVAEAAYWFVSMDRCCHVQLLAEAAGKPKAIGPADARTTRDTIGTPGIGRLNFRSVYADIVAAQPDLLD